jgi:hypothetical protein
MIQEAFSLSSFVFRSVKALAAESGSPETMPRAMSCFLYSIRQDNDQSRIQLQGKKVGGILTIFFLALFGLLSFKLLLFSKEDRVELAHFF